MTVATVEDILTVERSYLGEGGGRFWSWYPAQPGTPWCAIFQSFCLTSVGIPTHYAWVSGMFDAYRAAGLFTSTDVRQARPGDLVAFEWGTTPGGYDHVAMVESAEPGGCWTLNGNVNHSQVARIFFPFDGGGMAEIARPPYTQPEPEDEDMKNIILIDRRQSPPPAWLAFGNTKVWLSDQSQLDFLRSIGVPEVDPAPVPWLESLATLPRNDGMMK